MEALELTWSMGGIPEVDVRTTKDGVIMMFHDNNFARILPAASEEVKKKGLEDLTYDEARQLDIGVFRGESFAGQRIIRLARMLEALDGHRDRMLYIDIKQIDFEVLARQTVGYHLQLIVASTRYDELKQWKRVASRPRTLYWIGGKQDDLARRLAALRDVKFAHIDQVQIHVRIDENGVLSPSEAFLKRTGEELRRYDILFQTLSWTQGDRPETCHRLLDLGCASFATDYPEETMNAIKAYYTEKEQSR